VATKKLTFEPGVKLVPVILKFPPTKIGLLIAAMCGSRTGVAVPDGFGVPVGV
jgi:hypothetical protein